MNEEARVIIRGIEQQGSPYLFPGKDGVQRVDVAKFLQRIRKEADLPADFRPLHGYDTPLQAN